jgi:intein/homing endonuclease
LESKGIKDILKITLADGRVIECTPDHQIKVKQDNNYIYKEAKDLTENDNIVMSIEYPEDIKYDDENDWLLNMGDYEFNMNNDINREKSLAFARLLGYIHADGSITKDKRDENSYTTRLFIGHMIDVDVILNDIELITNVKCKVFNDNIVYFVNIPNKFGKEIASLDGITIGRRTTQEASLPKFLFENNCPKAFIREFLGGYFGGDGHSPYLMKNIFSSVKLSQSICEEFEESLINKMKDLISLLDKVDIKAKFDRVRDCHKNNQTYIDKPRIQAEISIDSNLDFSKKIGFRYCIQKAVRLSIAVSYERLCNTVKNQHNLILNKVNEKMNLQKENKEKLSIDKALIESRKECYEVDKPINQYYSSLTKDLIFNRRKKDRSDELINFDYKYFPRASDYLITIGCDNWFTKINGKMNYIVKKDMNYIPTWNMKISNICNNGQKKVFDIGVAEHHNFIANGIVAHNCIPSRMTVAQLIECVFGKVGALKGELMDGTPFDKIDVSAIGEKLKEYGFEENGEEEMYCGMTGKKLMSKIFIGPTFYMRLKHMVQDKIHCLTLDHDVLTKLGWKKYNELTYDDEIATLNVNTNMLEYNKPNNIYYYENYDGEMYEIKANNIDIKVTKDHRMLISDIDNKSDFKLVKVQDIKYPVYYKSLNEIILIVKENVIITNEKCPVFCVEVPNEIFYTRRNNKELWTGNSRASGPHQRLTRQPPEGRARDGGLRFGEMERDAMISHGCAMFLKERLVDTSDKYSTYVCNKCGIIASKKINKNVWMCLQCMADSEVSKITIPYAFKLLTQELMAINILPRIKVKQPYETI